jgi:hypothetical protein
MGENKTPFKTNINQSVKAKTRQKSRLSDYLSGKPKPLKTSEVNLDKERTHRVLWILKWVFLLPLSVYALFWLLVYIFDFFNT